MISSLPRPAGFDARPPVTALSAAGCVAGRAQRRSIDPVAAAAAVARAGREPQPAASQRSAPRPEPPMRRAGTASAPLLAQLLGQGGSPRDAVSAGRGQTSFRISHVERYEEVVRWTRRVELLFAFEGLPGPIPA